MNGITKLYIDNTNLLVGSGYSILHTFGGIINIQNGGILLGPLAMTELLIHAFKMAAISQARMCRHYYGIGMVGVDEIL